MRTIYRPVVLSALLTAWLLTACGGGGASDSAPVTTVPPATIPSGPGAPTSVNNTATDGLNWFNYRRAQAGLSVLTSNAQISTAAQAHSNYQQLNNTITHDETSGRPGFTGAHVSDRLFAAGYVLGSNGYAYGEVISATSNNSGFYMAEELITAIYHRFVIFEPKFKEIGTGAAGTGAGYYYLTADFAARNGYGPGIGATKLVNWPYNGQTGVPTNFFSDYESPDPVAGINEVGYPISVHADIDVTLSVDSFTVHPRGGSNLQARLLSHATDAETSASAAAIVPLSVLQRATTYDVSFSGRNGATAVTKTWSFTTK